MLKRIVFICTLLLLAAPGENAQPGPTLHFDVAAIKPADSSTPNRVVGGPGTKDPARITYNRTSLRSLIDTAYPQFRDSISGPGWLASEYSLTATLPTGTTKDQLAAMMANFLAERFNLQFHVLSKQIGAYELVVATGGARLTPTPVRMPGEPTPVSVPPGTLDAKGFPIPPFYSKQVFIIVDDMYRMTFTRTAMSEFASELSMRFTRYAVRVLDNTGLSGEFDFKLELPAPSTMPPPENSAVTTMADGSAAGVPVTLESDLGSISSAIEKQIGLRLKPIRITAETMVIDKLDRVPAGN